MSRRALGSPRILFTLLYLSLIAWPLVPAAK